MGRTQAASQVRRSVDERDFAISLAWGPDYIGSIVLRPQDRMTMTASRVFGWVARSVLGLFVLAVLAWLFVLPGVGRHYEAKRRAELLDQVARELPPKASEPEMRAFLVRHSKAGFVTDLSDGEITGVMPKTMLDRWLLDRQVQLVLKVDSSNRFSTAEVRFYYTFL